MSEKIHFDNGSGVKLCGILSNPGSEKVVVLAHGTGSTKDRIPYVNLERSLNAKGIATLRFDFFGHGESEGKFEDLTMTEAIKDVLAAIKFAKTKGFREIGLMGCSFGGMASIMAASQSKDLCVLALKCPVSDYMQVFTGLPEDYPLEQWKNNGFIYYVNAENKKFRLNYTYFLDVIKINVYAAAKNITIPTLIVHGDADDVVPVEQSKKTASLIKNCKLEIIPKAGHDFSGPGQFEKMQKLIADFLVKYLL